MPLPRRSSTLALLAGLVAIGTRGEAQTRLRVDPRASLAWWQVNPHLNHLWATTCPEEPSWRPGEGRSSGWVIGQTLKPPKHGYAGINDTTIVPLYPRLEATPLCTEAVEGQVLVTDTVRWQGVRGQVTVRAEALITGEERRDNYTHQAVLQTDRYPEITFTIDSVVNVTRQADTLRGTAVGVFLLHGVRKPMTAGVRAWPEAGGLRVLAKFRVPAPSLTQEFGLSRFALGLGVTTRIWYDLFMGVDVVLRSQGTAGN
jgi:YceI-like protein